MLQQRRRFLRLRSQQAELLRQTLEQKAQWRLLLHDQFAPLTRLMLRMEELHPQQPPDQELLDGLLSDLRLMQQLQLQMGLRMEESGSIAGRQTVPLDDICQQIARHYRRNCVEVSVPQLTLRVDVDQLRRVLHNLVDNALEHGSPPVRIRAYPVPEGLVLDVEDRGPALTRRASDRSGGWPHRGQGRALAIDFCGRHGGSLQLEPRSGSGLLVRLRLGQDSVLDGASSSLPSRRA